MAPVKKFVRCKTRRAFTTPPRVSSKKRGAANMDRHSGFASPLADIQGWKLNGSRMAHGNVVLQLAKSQRGGGEQVAVTATLCRNRLPE